MEAFQALLVIGGLIAVLWGWHKLKAAARKKLNRDVFQRKEHAVGQRMTSEQLTFVSECSPADVLSTVRQRLDLSGTSGALPRLYLVDADEDSLTFAQGSKLGDNFVAALMVEPDRSGSGCHGRFTVLTWTEVDGIVGHLDDLEYLRGAVEEAVRAMDPSARFDVAPL